MINHDRESSYYFLGQGLLKKINNEPASAFIHIIYKMFNPFDFSTIIHIEIVAPLIFK